jgi:hypothetical protein
LKVVNVSNPAQPVGVGRYESYVGSLGNVVVQGEHAYVTDGSEGFISLNVANPAAPRVEAVYNTPGLSNGFTVAEGKVYLADYYSLTILQLPWSDIDNSPQIPKRFDLSQNYPNPFNAQTTIQYSSPVQSDVRIDIFDILGRRVDSIVEGAKPAGVYQTIWDAGRFGSGIYFYRLKTNSYCEIKSCLLLK